VSGGLHVTRWGDGPPAVLVHGSFGWGEETWRAQRPLAETYELLLVDRRGFGRSPANGRVDFDRDADDVAELAEGAHLVGHSYGGVVALLAAARVSVRSLTVIEPPALSLVRDLPETEDFVRRIDEATNEATDAADYRLRFLDAFGFRPGEERLKDEALVAARASWGERPPTEAEIPLEQLARPFPKLVVRGAWDQAPPTARERGGRIFGAICDVLERRLGAESAVFAGAAHNPQLLGEPFNERLLAFWESAR
jgi:pimeloyl-ACP methyl ester carboxylesterase